MRLTDAHPQLWRRGCRSPPIPRSHAVSPLSRGSGPSPAPAGSRSFSVSPRGPQVDPRRTLLPSPPAISPGFASPGDLRLVPDSGKAR
ncbi:hypothetical protein NDU88_003804 [Pleurodeles waltl]|uniref:Uncharacterized protein n=1 Tax=Pleurodeles waltl TaxID=8319 RepID=A0AAV7SGZ1_PLEWA|nr:hypothetical protein NDU88_003804 [Pleurodeles waltl]